MLFHFSTILLRVEAFESTLTSSYLVYFGSFSFDEIVYLAVDFDLQPDFNCFGDGAFDHFLADKFLFTSFTTIISSFNLIFSSFDFTSSSAFVSKSFLAVFSSNSKSSFYDFNS